MVSRERMRRCARTTINAIMISLWHCVDLISSLRRRRSRPMSTHYFLGSDGREAASKCACAAKLVIAYRRIKRGAEVTTPAKASQRAR